MKIKHMFELQDLKYNDNELEPYISNKTIKYHLAGKRI